MKTLYIECNMGAAGDMLMAALLELLPDTQEFIKKMNSLGLPNLRVRAEESVKCGIKGTHVRVTVGGVEETGADIDMTRRSDAHLCEHNHGEHHHHDEHDHHYHDHHDEHTHAHDHHHEHDHAHSHTGLANIEKTVCGLPVSEKVKNDILGVYRLIAEAESRAHGRSVAEIHFHEVGHADALADITGVCLLMEEIAPRKIIASPVHVGSGFVRCAHGILPVPAPAAAHILKGVPSYGGNIQGELCTPTGAALLKYFAQSFGPMPIMTIAKIGYGMGKKDFHAANCVRVFLSESESGSNTSGPNGQAAELSCNIDDMSGEALGFACQALMEAGALDVFTIAAGMKKSRPGVLLTCVCAAEQADMFASLMLKHTTTFGVRKNIMERYTLEREIKTVETPFGKVRIKTGKGYGVTKSKPEYDDVAALAQAHTVSIYEMEKRIASFSNTHEGQHDH